VDGVAGSIPGAACPAAMEANRNGVATARRNFIECSLALAASWILQGYSEVL
jgi:hypothetical protein